MLLANKEGIIVTGPIVNLAAIGAANAVVVFTIPVLAGQLIGTKSVIIKKVNLYNNAAPNTQVLIGNGVGVGVFVALLPALDSFATFNDSYGPETDLIEAESWANITAYPVAIGGGTIDIQLEVAVIG